MSGLIPPCRGPRWDAVLSARLEGKNYVWIVYDSDGYLIRAHRTEETATDKVKSGRGLFFRHVDDPRNPNGPHDCPWNGHASTS